MLVFCIYHSNTFFYTRYSEHIYFRTFFTVCCESPEGSYFQVITLKHSILLLTNEGTFYVSVPLTVFLFLYSTNTYFMLTFCSVLGIRHTKINKIVCFLRWPRRWYKFVALQSMMRLYRKEQSLQRG